MPKATPFTAGGTAPLTPYQDKQSGVCVAPLHVGDAETLVDQLPCAVNLLPKFRYDELNKFRNSGASNLFLSGSRASLQSDLHGLLLYEIEQGRRNVVTLHIRLLCVADWNAETGRALVMPSAILQKVNGVSVSRVTAKIDKKNLAATDFWKELGFELTEDTAEKNIDAKAEAAAPWRARVAQHEGATEAAPVALAEPSPAASAAGASGPLQPHRAASGGSGNGDVPAKKKRGRPSKVELEMRALEAQELESGGGPSQRQRTGDAFEGTDPRYKLEASMGTTSATTATLQPPQQYAPEGDAVEDEEQADVYIRRACPGSAEAHLVRVPCGAWPFSGSEEELWVKVPEDELERQQTVQCVACNRVLLLSRDEAEEYQEFTEEAIR